MISRFLHHANGPMTCLYGKVESSGWKRKKKVKAREVVLVADANEFMGLELQMLYCIMSIAGVPLSKWASSISFSLVVSRVLVYTIRRRRSAMLNFLN